MPHASLRFPRINPYFETPQQPILPGQPVSSPLQLYRGINAGGGSIGIMEREMDTALKDFGFQPKRGPYLEVPIVSIIVYWGVYTGAFHMTIRILTGLKLQGEPV